MNATTTFEIGQIITNGSSAGRVATRADKDRTWGCGGWRVENISLEPFGGNRGMTSFVADHILSDWKVIEVDRWAPIVGGSLEECFSWSKDWTWLVRHVRKVEPAPAAVPSPWDSM